jgi:hypothetical protein
MQNYFGKRQSEVNEQTVSSHVENKWRNINNGGGGRDAHAHPPTHTHPRTHAQKKNSIDFDKL